MYSSRIYFFHQNPTYVLEMLQVFTIRCTHLTLVEVCTLSMWAFCGHSFFHHTPTFEWYMERLVITNGNQKYELVGILYYNEIGLWANIIDISRGLIINTDNWEALCARFRTKINYLHFDLF